MTHNVAMLPFQIRRLFFFSLQKEFLVNYQFVSREFCKTSALIKQVYFYN